MLGFWKDQQMYKSLARLNKKKEREDSNYQNQEWKKRQHCQPYWNKKSIVRECYKKLYAGKKKLVSLDKNGKISRKIQTTKTNSRRKGIWIDLWQVMKLN